MNQPKKESGGLWIVAGLLFIILGCLMFDIVWAFLKVAALFKYLFS